MSFNSKKNSSYCKSWQVTEELKTNTGMHISYITRVEYLLSIKGTADPNMKVADGLKTNTGMHIIYICNSSLILSIKGTPDPNMQIVELKISTGRHICIVQKLNRRKI